MLLIDTAGRLHNKQALMDELAKVVRVLQEARPGRRRTRSCWCSMPPPARTRAARSRRSARWCRSAGSSVTKLDGTARGGVVVALARQFGLPVRALGIGEGIEDLRPFEAQAFADALLGVETA